MRPSVFSGGNRCCQDISMCMYTYTDTYGVDMYVAEYIHGGGRVGILLHIYFIYTYTHARVCLCVYIYIHTYIHTYICLQACDLVVVHRPPEGGNFPASVLDALAPCQSELNFLSPDLARVLPVASAQWGTSEAFLGIFIPTIQPCPGRREKTPAGSCKRQI